MKRAKLGTGAWVGALTSLPVMGALYLGNQFLGTFFVPFDFYNWQARIIPTNPIGLAMGGLGLLIGRIFPSVSGTAAGKTLEQIAAIILFAGLGALVGLAITWVLRRTERSPQLIGAIVGLVFLALTAGMEVTFGVPDMFVRSVIWLGVVYVGWSVFLSVLLSGELLVSLSAEMQPERRASVLKLAGSAIGMALAAWGIGSLVGDDEAGAGADQPLTGLAERSEATPIPQPTPVTTVDPNIPVGNDGRIVPAPGTRSELTPTPDFYRVDISASPVELDEDEWRLEVAGLFDKKPRLTIDDLKAYPVHVQPITLSCVSNSVGGGAISTANWIGLRLSDLLENLGMQSPAQSLYLDAADGFYETVVMDDLMDPRTLLVYGMNDVTLPVGHGFPLRIYIPNRYGMKQPKWITRMEAIEGEGAGYWVDRGWSRTAIAKTTSVIDVVAKDAEHNGRIPVGGIAWAGSRGIQNVELEIDGEWVQTSLRTPPLGPLTWVQWRYDWDAAPGEHTLRVRATDGTGELQTEKRTGARPDGATGYHTMDVQI